MNVGDYVSRLPGMSLDTFAFDAPQEWLNSWTLFFWAWWIAWAPFVGLFLARISRGRTIRQFIGAVLTIPFAFIALWIAIFGNAALSVVIDGNSEFGETAMSAPRAPSTRCSTSTPAPCSARASRRSPGCCSTSRRPTRARWC